MTKKKIFIGLSVIIVVGALFWLIKQNSTSNIQYKKFTAEKSDLAVSILATGTVQPENRLEIKAPIAGRVDKVLVNEGDVVKKSQILAWMSSTERAALIDAARARGPEEVKHWEELYKPTPIIAPLAGTLILRNVEPGQTITSTDAILAMSDRLTVKAQVDETDIAKIKLHQKAEIILDAYPEQKIQAQVDQIAFEARTVNNVTTYVVDVLPERVPEMFRSGMTANVNFQVESKKDVLTIPAEALQIIDGKSKVLVKTDSKTPEEREISVGISDGKKTEVLEGLSENDVVLRAEATKKNSGSNPFAPFSGKRPPGTGRSR